MSPSADVVVLGAGPAGLGAALLLARRGVEVIVVERAPVVGGLAASFDVAGVRVDHGSHRLHPAIAPEILSELRALLGPDLQTRVRHGRIRMANTFVAFPPRPLDLARRLPPALTVALARDALRRSWRRSDPFDHDSFSAAVRAALGPTLAARFYEPYVRKIWGADPVTLDAELARRRVSARTSADLVRRALHRRGATARTFLYPRRGFGALGDVLAAAAVEAGATIRTSAEVVGIDAQAGGVRVRLTPGGAVHAAQVWSTLPLPVLARLATPIAPQPVLDAAARLRFRALVLVYLAIDRPAWTEYDAHYFPELDVPMARVSEPKRYRDSRDDPSDRTVLCAELPCSADDSTWKAAPDVLAGVVTSALARARLPAVDPAHVEVRRVAHAYPVYDHGFAFALATLEAWADSLPRVLTFGRHGLFAHDNTHHALAMAWAAAASADGRGAIDLDRWRTQRETFRAHVVED